jgi:hypothetical protein
MTNVPQTFGPLWLLWITLITSYGIQVPVPAPPDLLCVEGPPKWLASRSAPISGPAVQICLLPPLPSFIISRHGDVLRLLSKNTLLVTFIY